MVVLLDVLAAIYTWLIAWKYTGAGMKGAKSANDCFYGPEEAERRVSEEIGREMLKEHVRQQYRIVKVRPLTLWEERKFHQIGRFVGAQLIAAGWTAVMLNQYVDKVIERIAAEEG